MFPHWSQKTITQHCLSLFPVVSWVGYQTNYWLLRLGELLHDPPEIAELIQKSVCLYALDFVQVMLHKTGHQHLL